MKDKTVTNNNAHDGRTPLFIRCFSLQKESHAQGHPALFVRMHLLYGGTLAIKTCGTTNREKRLRGNRSASAVD
jgi:hypothetical protein